MDASDGDFDTLTHLHGFRTFFRLTVEGGVGSEDSVLRDLGKVFLSPNHAPGVPPNLALDGLEQGDEGLGTILW